MLSPPLTGLSGALRDSSRSSQSKGFCEHFYSSHYQLFQIPLVPPFQRGTRIDNQVLNTRSNKQNPVKVLPL